MKKITRADMVRSFKAAEAAYSASRCLTGPDAQDTRIVAWRSRNEALAALRAFDLESGS